MVANVGPSALPSDICSSPTGRPHTSRWSAPIIQPVRKSSGGPAGLPRFTAVSELFELVGVLDGRRLTLYLDRFADGSPVTNGRIELELGAARYTLTADEGGDFSVTLPRAPAPGTLPVTATVLAGEQSDLLAGVLTVAPAAEAAPAPQRMTAGRLAGWGGLAGVLLLGAGLTWRRGRVGAANQREAA